MKKVVLFKAESDSTKEYISVLKQNNFEVISIPIIEFNYKNLSELKCKLKSEHLYSGIIFTSPRSVDACQLSLRNNNDDDLEVNAMAVSTDSNRLLSNWNTQSHHNYCVGEQTHKLIQSTFNNLKVDGKNTGNANNLADLILEQLLLLQEPNEKQLLPFLFPCGNLHQDTLHQKLKDKYELDTVECYETVEHSKLMENIRRMLIINDSINEKFNRIETFFVFFSPSGFIFAMNAFKKLNYNMMNNGKLIAIGPTTKNCIEKNDYTVFGTAEKPSIEYLIKILI